MRTPGWSASTATGSIPTATFCWAGSGPCSLTPDWAWRPWPQWVRELTGLPVTAALTHAHWDHIGGLGEFRERLVHESEASWLSGSFPVPISVVQSNLTLPPHDFPSDFDPKGYALYSGGPTSILSDGQAIDLGDRTVTVLHTPGHSPATCAFGRRNGAPSIQGTCSTRASWTCSTPPPTRRPS